MKNLIFLALSIFLICFETQAAKKPNAQKICAQLAKEADANCRDAICADAFGPGSLQSDECVIDDEFRDALQICAEEELPNLVADFNQQYPRARLHCN